MEKKNKVRTYGNCAYLVKKDRKNYYYYRVYKCMNEDSDYMGSAWKNLVVLLIVLIINLKTTIIMSKL